MSYFGTDGIRGTFGVFPITPDFLLRLGFAAGLVLNEQSDNHRPSVLIGKDTRLSGYVIEAALQAGFNAAGVDVHMLGVIPTPAIAHLTRSFHADMGVVISASHNPYSDNGIKFFSPAGKKISDATQERINTLLDDWVDGHSLPILDGISFDSLGKNHRIDDAVGRYIEFCKGSFPYTQDLRHLTIALDCANGAAYKVAPRVFRELGANVIVMSDTPDGRNINDNCGSTHPEALQDFVKSHHADIGIALDGDGDRIIMVDHLGNVVDGDGILYILATHAQNKPAGVVGTVMSNMALQLALQQQGIAFVRAKVGDRYVMQALDEHGWQLGGESSGHILTLDKAGTGDAIIAGLQVLACMAYTRQSLASLLDGYHPMPQVLINVKVAKKQDPYQIPALTELFAKAEHSLANQGRLLIRPSGTEPLIRVMVESNDAHAADALARSLAHAIQQHLA